MPEAYGSFPYGIYLGMREVVWNLFRQKEGNLKDEKLQKESNWKTKENCRGKAPWIRKENRKEINF